MKMITFRKYVDLIISELAESSSNLTLGHLGLFVLISRKLSECVTLQELMRQSGLSKNTLRLYIKDLEESGMIIKSHTIKGIIFNSVEGDCSSGSKFGIPDPTNTHTIISTTSKNKNSISLDIHNNIINDLNLVSGRNFRLNATDTIKKITWLLSHDYTFDDFKKVHRNKLDWLTSPKMAAYYRPKTLYAQENFESYLNEQKVVDSTKATTTKWLAPEVQKKSSEHRKKLEERWSK